MDSPGLFDTGVSHETIAQRIEKAISTLHPGPHAILYTVQIGNRFTEEELNTFKRLKTYFGQGFVDHMVMVFTYGDILEKKGVSINDYLHKASQNLQQVLREISQRHVVFNNESSDRLQVGRLIKVVEFFGGSCYNVEAARRALLERVREAEEAEIRRTQYYQRLEEERRRADAEKRRAQSRAKLNEAAAERARAKGKRNEARRNREQAAQKTKEANTLRNSADAQYGLFNVIFTLGISTMGASNKYESADRLQSEARDLNRKAGDLEGEATSLERQASRLDLEAISIA